MATQEKLLKSLEILKTLSSPNQTFDPSKKKDKIQHCHIVTEAISNSTIKIAPSFTTYLSITIEVLLQLCDDQESDVRMTAGDCLNKVIRAMNDGNIGKVQIELHKGIKQNGSARSLRAALKRFAQLAHLIRPHKGKPYVVNLFPTLIKVSERPEEQIHETLAISVLPIMKVLGCFASDIEIKGLLKGFLKNVSHSSPVIRRSATTCVLNVCLNCRKPYIFMTYVINFLLDLLIPISDNQSCYLILGVLSCLKNLLQHLKDQTGETSNFETQKGADFTSISVDKLLQIYELCLHYFANKDHNVVNAALETLNILLQNCPTELKQILLSESGIDKSRINLPTSYSMSALRSPSQLSVATSSAAEDLFVESELTETLRTDIEKWIDESKLSVMNVPCAKTNELEKSLSVESRNSSLDVSLTQIDFDDKISEYTRSHSAGDNLERLTISDDSSEKSFSYIEDDKNCQDIPIGGFLDSDVSLIYCARLITKSFLLSGHKGVCISDKSVRVSVKSLALSCLASIIKISPKIFLICLGKKCNRGAKNHLPISDLFLYENHTDPQLRGIFRLLLTNFISAVLSENYKKWLEENCCEGNFSKFELNSLVKIIIKGLQDESSNCTRQTILSLNPCLEQILESEYNAHVLPILNCLPLLAKNPYWLVKVALCELVSKLPYVTIFNVTGSNDFQDRIINDVLFNFLQNDDARVRNGAANAIVCIISYLYYEQFQLGENSVTSKAINYKNLYLSNLSDRNTENDLTKKHLVDNMPFPFSNILQKSCDKLEYSLSKIVTKLYHFLLTATSNYFIYGCIETLSLLSNTYLTTVYKNAWNCCKITTDNENPEITLDLFNICVYLLSHSIICYDLTCHLNLLNLSSNLYAGYSLFLIKPISDDPSMTPWDMFSHQKFSKLSEHYLSHLVKLLNILHYVLDDVTPSPLQSKPVLPNLTTASPIKRRKSDLEKKVLSPNKTLEKDDKKESKIGSFFHLPHYLKFYEILKQAYTNYKVTLESESCEKFSGLLKQTLHSFSVLMEVGTLVEFQGVAEDILSYFRFTFTLEASATVECVQQLLKCLSGNNLTSNIALIREETEEKSEETGFYYNLYQKPYDDVSSCFKSFKNIHKIECDGDNTIMGYLHRRDVKPALTSRSSDKILANYIRIFEPMVIKSLKHYTITSDVKLQCKVLQLLNQLIQLRVNYCLLDSEQIFIGFVLKQFDYIEKGQIPFANDLIKKIFQFLVQLSHSKQHSKSIITIPKIIHLCDGLMASEQSPLTHCIPALEPIVENIFLTRNKSNTVDAKELETTRDVVLSMLLRLYEYHGVIDLIALILDDSKYCSNSEKWLRWSNQVIDVVLPMLKQNKIRLDNIEAWVSLRKLVFVLEPSVFEPIDNVLLLLFQEPLIYDNWQLSYTRRLGKILIGLLIISAIKEDTLIAKINELKGEFAPGSIFENCVPTADPLNVLNSVDIFREVSPEMIFMRFLFRVLNLASRICFEMKNDGNDFFIEEISIFLMYCIHIFQSGSHCKIANYAISNTNLAQLEEISANFLKVSTEYPVLVFLWSYILTLMNYNERKFWSKVANLKPDSSINQKILSTGSVILFCDYMNQDVLKSDQLSWFLINYIIQVVQLCDEEPISEFISSVHRNSATSKIFIDSLISQKIDSKDSVFVLQVLKSVENTHSYHTGSLLKLLLPKLLISKELAIARLVANLASRKIELLLTMTMPEVHEQLAREELLGIIKNIVALNLVKKHEALSSLLNKLCTQYYDISPLEFDQKRSVNPDYIKKLEINKSWYLAQIREKCNNKETAQLLTRLDYEELCNFLRNATFSKVVFKECLRLGLELKNGSEEPALITATVTCLLEEVTRVCEKNPDEVFSEEERLFTQIYELIPSINFYIISLSQLPEPKFSDLEIFVKFGVICFQSINYLVSTRKEFNINFINLALNCCESVLKEKKLFCILNQDSHISWLSSIISNLYKLVVYLLGDKELPTVPKIIQNTSVSESCYQIYTLVTWLYKTESDLPKFLFQPIKNIIVSLSRLAVVNSFVLIPTQVLKSGWSPELSGNFHTQFPPLPIEFLQEIDVLEEFIFRTTLLGWTSRQQFEETWMSLLSVLCNNFEDKDSLVVQDVVHASSLAVKAITALLVQTLYLPEPGNTNVGELIHVSRHTNVQIKNSVSLEKLKKIHDTIEKRHHESDYLPKIMNIFHHPNLEKRFKHYSYGQISVKYLSIASKIMEIDDEISQIWKHKENLLESNGLDINSCLQFLLDYYTQLLKNQGSTPLRFLHEIVRSTVIISDLFTDKSQFSWMLEVFLELSKLHTVEDELLHQYLIVGISKATAVLTPDLETYEVVKKLLTQYLKSSFLPSRMACLHGLLYLLEGCKLSNISIGGISEEMQIILPCAIEYVQCNLNSNNEILRRSQEHTVLVWTLAFFIIENIDETHLESNFVTNILSTAFSVLLQQKSTSNNLQTILMKALERLVIFKKNITKNIGKQVMSLALEKTKTENPYISILGLQLLLTYMYTDCSEQLEAVNSQTNPDHLVQTIEKVSAIFEHIKRGYMSEVEILCFILPDILNDFFSPADILTKVISEFLSPQQPHPKLLSKVVFRVFERAIEEKQLPLLQDWVVFSLSNFTQSLSVGMATWCLTWFFISASSNEWLRLFFPYVQTRVGRYEYEDRKMLCIAGSDFYKNLTNQNQKETFIENFNKIKDQPDTLFNDLLSSL